MLPDCGPWGCGCRGDDRAAAPAAAGPLLQSLVRHRDEATECKARSVLSSEGVKPLVRCLFYVISHFFAETLGCQTSIWHGNDRPARVARSRIMNPVHYI